MENKDDEYNERELNFSDYLKEYPTTKDECFKDNDWTWEKNYDFRDPVVSRVVDQFVKRSNTGYDKYGQTLDSERRNGVKDLKDYLQDIQEELMDAILYIQAAKEDLACTPQCKCQVKDVENKTTLSELKALEDLKRKMDFKAAEKRQLEWGRENYPKEFYGADQVIWDKDNHGYTSDHT